VDESRKTILALQVSQVPALGHLARHTVKKSGHRKDEHSEGLTRMCKKITLLLVPEVLVNSDEHERDPSFISAFPPKAKYL
jgi:hypothetical protein